VVHPGHDDIIRAQNTDGRKVVERMRTHDYGTPLVVFKQMTHHLIDLPADFPEGMHNVLLIRDPRRILASYGKVVDGITELDIGIPQQDALYERLRASGSLTAVIDARRLLLDPAGVLGRLCDRLAIDFDPAMLSWPAGPKLYDGVWAPYWYGGVHRSTGFQPYEEVEVVLKPQLERIARSCQPVYERLLREAL
jgi:hypothetical protein